MDGGTKYQSLDSVPFALLSLMLGSLIRLSQERVWSIKRRPRYFT